jgi:hypothetical protein
MCIVVVLTGTDLCQREILLGLFAFLQYALDGYEKILQRQRFDS